MSAPESPLPAQAALEQAVVDAVLAGGLGYSSHQCGRCFDGRPPATKGDVFVGVHGTGERRSAMRSCLDEVLGVRVTLSMKAGRRARQTWHLFRDEIEQRLALIAALVHRDSLDHRVIRAANTLAGYEAMDGVMVTTTRHAGFVRGLMFEGFGPVEVKRAEWWESEEKGDAGLAQTATFTGARRIRATATA